jgi:hypothetical protein
MNKLEEEAKRIFPQTGQGINGGNGLTAENNSDDDDSLFDNIQVQSQSQGTEQALGMVADEDFDKEITELVNDYFAYRFGLSNKIFDVLVNKIGESALGEADFDNLKTKLATKSPELSKFIAKHFLTIASAIDIEKW